MNVMSAALLRDHKLQRLRGLEQFAYQVAHFILQDEVLAAEAAKAALLELSRMEKPLAGSEEDLRSHAKKVTMNASIKIARTASIANQTAAL
ncbi:hypothetical protein [Paenibacillus sp. PL91]|uniref:hypothetical protein n=1 Tax=Paenibacillus sp. PL91 TaxID=2729538 RepID=UPI00145CC7A9|nr:hypothetical protein [Paenibacillus sp. PL91]MBC9204405.1 hypothetical protein [Paenibacillus sp. PL91]